MTRQVDFMVIGAQKSGTSTLYNVLDSHPRVVGSRPKEPHFFSTSVDWAGELDRYHRLFPAADDALYFEASTSYTFYPLRNLGIWEDLYQYNPRLKLIYIVRDPVDRIVSNYMHMYLRGYTDRSLEEEVIRSRFYIDVSRYATQIRPFIRRFGRDRVAILFFEDLVDRPAELFATIGAFLDVDPAGFEAAAGTHANRSVGGRKTPAKFETPLMRGVRRVAPPLWRALARTRERRFDQRPSLDPAHREVILTMLESEIGRLEEITGRDLSSWRKLRGRGSSSPRGAGRE